ncbi:substrate-binding periplasmic protein [Undibacterium oligocarboniphilum]|uniref:ABC transporter substrate-binding protein n=1 Tax=Undibacterium oligocarboniphilum TaxID=666702 RepID=A0A850QJM1_9BURK|nr:transporter substrate-binding domain-containing protein [Undibacterium oligocarboniphilum]MBC3869326.1 ABC transporter substrate-binding protein [Undibacterium oligocarboniphilum]NVO77705.1 ABC transporter substrate-binding protein [Undibacterium oligocarboniphilum]
MQIIILDDTRPSSVAAREVLQQAYQRLKIPVQFIEVPAKRGIGLLQAGSADGVTFRLTLEPDYDMLPVKVPVTSEELMVYTSGKNFEVHGFASLQPYLTGYVNGVLIIAEHTGNLRTDTAPSIDSLFRKLAAGRTDIALESRQSLCHVIRLGLTQIVMLEPSLMQRPGFHVLHKKYQTLIPKLEVVLSQMEKQGEIRKINEAAIQSYLSHCHQGLQARS